MPIITIIVVLVVVGVILWLVNTQIPMDNRIKTIINVLVGLALFLWVLQLLGVWHGPAMQLR
jgi:hypothetical protein